MGALKEDLKDMDVLCHLQNQDKEPKFRSKAGDNIQIKIKMPSSSQEPPASSKATNQDLKDMDVLCTFNNKVETKIRNIGVPKASDQICIKIKMPNLSQESPVSSKATNHDLKDMYILCTFKIKIESQNSERRCIKDWRPYPNEDQEAIP